MSATSAASRSSARRRTHTSATVPTSSPWKAASPSASTAKPSRTTATTASSARRSTRSRTGSARADKFVVPECFYRGPRFLFRQLDPRGLEHFLPAHDLGPDVLVERLGPAADRLAARGGHARDHRFVLERLHHL